MGWLLTLMLAVPQVDGPLQIEMWFSRETYCSFAADKFAEQPMFALPPGQPKASVRVISSTCRELRAEEANRVPPHMRPTSPETDTGF